MDLLVTSKKQQTKTDKEKINKTKKDCENS